MQTRALLRCSLCSVDTHNIYMNTCASYYTTCNTMYLAVLCMHPFCVWVCMLQCWQIYICMCVNTQSVWTQVCKRHWCFIWHTGSVHTLKIWATYASWNIYWRSLVVCKVCKSNHSTILVYSWCSCCWYFCYISTCSYLNIKSETISLACPLLHYSRLILYPPKKNFYQY